MTMLLLAALTFAPPLSPPAGQTPPAAAARQAPDSDQTVAVTKGARLSLQNDAGDIIVRGWDRDEVRVQARHSARTTVRIRPTATVVSITATAQRGLPGSVDYEISVPRWMPLKLGSLAGYIQVDDLQADVSIEAFRGEIVVRGVRGAVDAQSFDGQVTVERVNGRIQASGVNRGVVLSEIAGDIVADSISGGVRMSGIRSGSMEVSSLSGGITFAGEFSPGGSYRLTSHSGSIVITTSALDATLTVRTYSGRFESVFRTEQVGTPRLGQAVTYVAGHGKARVTLETFSGNVRIRRPD